MNRGNLHDPVYQLGAEEHRCDIGGIAVIHVEQHPAEIVLTKQFLRTRRKLFTKPKLYRKFPCAEVGHAVALSAAQTAFHNVLKLAGIVGRRSLVGHFKVRFNDIVDIAQYHCGTLLNAFRRGEIQLTLGFCNPRLDRTCVDGVLYLISADVGEVNRRTDMNAVDDPAKTGVPVNTFQQPSCRRGCHAVIADAFGLHFGSAE